MSISAAYSVGGEEGRGGAAGQRCSLIEVSLSSLGAQDGGSDEPTDEGQEFSSDSMSDHTESAVETTIGLAAGALDPMEQLDMALQTVNLSEQKAESKDEREGEGEEKQTEALEQSEQQNELENRGGGVGFFFQVRTYKRA